MPVTGSMHHEPTSHRYVWLLDDEVVGVIDYREQADQIEMHHTYTTPAYRGRGIAAELVGAALDDVRARGLRVVPTCWYVAEHIDAHPEHQDLLAGRSAERRG
ncbi:MAG TPA: GNAT family N-acetyltransferase [Acidimicrobiia bacterium]|jgi:hypothetical protein